MSGFGDACPPCAGPASATAADGASDVHVHDELHPQSQRVVCEAFDRPLTIEDGPDLVAGPGQVVVDVEAAGANFVDALIVQGRYQMKPEVPFTPGMEVAGRVEGPASGSLALCWSGGYASQVVVPESSVVPIPDAVPWARRRRSCRATPRCCSRSPAARPSPRRVDRGPRRRWRRRPRSLDVGKALGGKVVACASTTESSMRLGGRGGRDVRLRGSRRRPQDRHPGGDRWWRRRRGRSGRGAKTEAALRSLRWGGRYVVIGFASARSRRSRPTRSCSTTARWSASTGAPGPSATPRATAR